MKASLKILITQFAYNGNSGLPWVISSFNPYYIELGRYLDAHPMVGPGNWTLRTYSDTPVTMTRNQAARDAKREGYDFLIMFDSDNVIDLFKNEKGAKPFVPSSLDFAIPRLLKGLPTCIAAPYCGQPPDPISGGHENIFAFNWEAGEHDNPTACFGLQQYSVPHAAIMSGIQPAGAGATGAILYSVSCFDLLKPPYFRYEWKDEYQDEKASTEDVQNTRDISMASWAAYGENCFFINWDAWAGHVKPKVVGRPRNTPAEAICETFREQVLINHKAGDRKHFADFPMPKPVPQFNPEIPNGKHKGNGQKPVMERMQDLVADIPPPSRFPNAVAEFNGRPCFRTPQEAAEFIRSELERGNVDREFAKRLSPKYDPQAIVEKAQQDAVQIENGTLDPLVRNEIIASRPVKQLGFGSDMNDMKGLTHCVERIEQNLGRPIRVLEIGSWCGASAVAICAGFEHEESKVYCVDTWQGSTADQTSAWVAQGALPRKFFDENTQDLQEAGKVIPIHGESSAVAAKTFDNPDFRDFDLIVIDAGHTFEEVSRDHEVWFNRLTPDTGVELFHDFGDDGHPAVTRFCQEKFGDKLHEIADTHWALVVKGEIEQEADHAEHATNDIQTEVRALQGSEAAQ